MNLIIPAAKQIVFVTFFLIAAAVFAQPLFAQDTRGTIRGTITDANGATLPDVTVKVIDTARNTRVDLTSNDEGFYQATYLTPGTYQVIVEVNGFKRVVRENIIVQINQTVQIDIPLEVGATQETVTVSTENPPLDTAKSDLGLTIDRRRVEELPLVHGNPYSLIGLSPGVAPTGNLRLDRPFEPTGIVGFAIDGTRGNRSDLTIDGAPSTATANANEVIASYVPPTDIIGEFKVQTATFDAQFGNTEGGVTSISIKSGTNELHGSAYYFAEPAKLSANDFFGNARGTARPNSKSDRFGFSINGPVRIPFLYNGRDKTFFLVGYEGIRDSRPRFDAGNTAFVPTADLRNGDFSAFPNVTIYDPLTRVSNGSGGFIGQPFAGNIIPQNRISPIARAVLSFYPQPKNPGLLGNIFDSALPEVTKPYDNLTVKIDQNISDKNRLFVRGSGYNRHSLLSDYLGSTATGLDFSFKSYQGVIDDVHSFDANTVLNVRFSYNRFIRLQDQKTDARGFDLTKLGFDSRYNNLTPAEVRRFPRFDFQGGLVGTGYGNENRPIDTQSYAAILNKVVNRHSLKFGGELRIYREDSFFNSNDQTGQFIFDNTFTRQSSTAGPDVNGLQAFAAFLLGLPTTAQVVRRADYSEYSKTYGFFAHDDWRVNNKLTLNLGLRYEVETPLVERNNKSVSGFESGYQQPFENTVRTRLAANPIAGVDSNLNVRGGLQFAGVDTGKGLYKTPKNTFLPRLGFAYQLNSKTVIRGGFGLFAGFLGQRRGDVAQTGFSRTTTVQLTANANGAQIPNSIANFANTTVLEPLGNALGRQAGLGETVLFFNQNPSVSKQARYQIGVQRDFGHGFIGEAVYVGNYGYNIEIVRNINALPNQYLNTDNFRSAAQTANNAFLTTLVANPFQGLQVNGISVFAGTSLNNASIQRQQLLRPFPQFGDILTTNNDGKSSYHAAQFSLNKRFSQGYTVQAGYTFSKWIQQTEYLNAGDAKPIKMISDQDTPHRFSFSGSVDLPFGKNKLLFSNADRLTNAIIGGFQIQGIYIFQIGYPIAFNSPIFYNGGEVAISPNSRSTGRYFNTDAFTSVLSNTATSATPVFQLRTLPFRFSNVRRDNLNNFDVSLLKNVEFNERMKLQLRFEVINALNEPYFPSPIINPTATSFGQIAASNQDNYARRVQVGIKFLF